MVMRKLFRRDAGDRKKHSQQGDYREGHHSHIDGLLFLSRKRICACRFGFRALQREIKHETVLANLPSAGSHAHAERISRVI